MKSLKQLNSRGFSHVLALMLVVMVVAVGGTFSLVASKAATTDNATASVVKQPKVKKGHLLIYSQNGRYDSTKIEVYGNTKARKCGGQLGINGSTVKKLRKAGPVKVSCEPVAGDEGYRIYFGNNKKFASADFVTVDVNSETCHLIHKDVKDVRSVPAVNGSCSSQDGDTTPAKLGLTMRVLPELKLGKVKGFVEMSVPGTDLNKNMCTGQVTVSFSPGNSSYALPIKYAKPSGNNTNGYCVAKLKSSKLNHGKHTITASYAGSPYFNAQKAAADVIFYTP
jgi:hypothetical protein